MRDDPDTAMTGQANSASAKGLQPLAAGSLTPREDAHWYALYTLPQNEFMVAGKLAALDFEAYLPTFEVAHTWKNRRRMKIVKPVFPTYVFVRAKRDQRGMILSASGAIRVVGSHSGPAMIPDIEIEFLRVELNKNKIEPYQEFAVGKRVRIKRGPMEGFEGVLVRKANGLRFVLTIQAIQQSVALEIPAEDLELTAGAGLKAATAKN